MKKIILALAMVLTGCSTVVPIEKEFPVAPQVLLERCPDLMVIDDGKNSLRDMLKVVIQNYATYYQCAEKTQGWQDWYKDQKKIFNGSK
jgi:hypothetical protein